mmetsp:Transcript_46128/g.53404  ORF Transcript_46128/g.53404 Transcript_46128/m.53404 type:complete len:298 (-) Transcript_46128:122-1015(-)
MMRVAGISAALIIIRIYISCWTSFLQPRKLWLDNIHPSRIFVSALFSVWRWWHWNSFFIPVNTATAVRLSSVLVAGISANTGHQMPPSQCLLTWNFVTAVEWSSKISLNTADLVSSPITEELAAFQLKQLLETRIEAEAAKCAVSAITVRLTSVSSILNPSIFTRRRFKAPIATRESNRRVSGAWSSAEVRVTGLRTNAWSDTNWDIDSIDDLDIIVVSIKWIQSKLSLSRWRLEAVRACTFAISAVSSDATFVSTASSASNNSTPDGRGNVDTLFSSMWSKFVVIVRWSDLWATRS